jgi:O-acetyl-ADP-ribose deacetylase (regulator of RNase III)
MNANVKTLIGDLFASEAQTLVNTVNTVGVMGKGIALGFRERFPDMYRDYVHRCDLGEVKLGRPYLWTPILPPWVLNFPTKEHWRGRANLEEIVHGLEYLEANYKAWGIKSLAVPPLGCGEGGLEWEIVGRTLYPHLSRLDIPVELYAPYGTPAAQLDPEFLGTHALLRDNLKVSPGAVAIADIVGRLNRQPYHTPVGRVVFQKLAYFATEAGIPTGFSYTERSFGPYSPEAEDVKRKLLNNGVLAEQELRWGPSARSTFVSTPGPTFDVATSRYESILVEWDDAIEAVVDLFMRIRSTRQAEAAATVHFAATTLRKAGGRAPTEMEVLDYVRKWKARRSPPLGDEELAVAIRALNALGWLELPSSRKLPVSAY